MTYNSSFRLVSELSPLSDELGLSVLLVFVSDESGRFNLKGIPAFFLMNLYISTTVRSPSKVICKKQNQNSTNVHIMGCKTMCLSCQAIKFRSQIRRPEHIWKPQSSSLLRGNKSNRHLNSITDYMPSKPKTHDLRCFVLFPTLPEILRWHSTRNAKIRPACDLGTLFYQLGEDLVQNRPLGNNP